MSCIRSKETNVFKESTPIDDDDYKCVVETCVDNYDLSTWGADAADEADAETDDYELEQEKSTESEDDFEQEDTQQPTHQDCGCDSTDYEIKDV